MDNVTLERIEKLERQVAILQGKPDPGLPCKGVPKSYCLQGMVNICNEGVWTRGKCPTCNGEGRVYPKEQ